MSNIFHQHLVQCQQCREHPNNLCPEGFCKLQEAAGVKPLNPEMTVLAYVMCKVANHYADQATGARKKQAAPRN